MTANLPLPPFGRVLLSYQQESIRLDFPVYIFVGKNAKDEAYSHKKIGALCTFLPPNDDCTKYRWPLFNQKVIVFDTGFSSAISLKKMCAYLISSSKPRVIFLYSESIPNEIFLPEGAVSNG